MTESTVSEVVERLEKLCAQEWPDTDFVYACDRITLGFLRTLLSTIKATGGRPSREEVARIVYEQAFERVDGLKKPAWVTGGNALKQDEARKIADAVLSLFSSEGKEGHGLSRDHEPTTCIALERTALEGIALCIDNAIKPSNGPHRFFLPSGEVMVGEIADTVYRILTGLRDIAREGLSSQTQVAGESSRDTPKSLSQPDHAPGEGSPRCAVCGSSFPHVHTTPQPQTEGGAA